jgi:hypothetical protein
MTDKLASQQIDDIIELYDGWKGDILAQLRTVITAADPGVIEEVKWKMPSNPQGRPVWTHTKMLCFVEIWKDNVKLLFVKGAHLRDPNHLFNARLESTDIRAIEFHEGDSVDEAGLKSLVFEAIELNQLKMR